MLGAIILVTIAFSRKGNEWKMQNMSLTNENLFRCCRDVQKLICDSRHSQTVLGGSYDLAEDA